AAPLSVYEYSGPATTASSTPKAASTADGPNIEVGVRTFRSLSGAGGQTALFHAFASAGRERREVRREATTAAYAAGVPWATLARRSPSLPRKPLIGGIPARFIAGTKKRIRRAGASFASPPRCAREVVPLRRSTSPATRNNAVCTVMWWAT